MLDDKGPNSALELTNDDKYVAEPVSLTVCTPSLIVQSDLLEPESFIFEDQADDRR